MENFRCALSEVKPAFGAVVDTLDLYRPNGMISSGARMEKLMTTCKVLVKQVRVKWQADSHGLSGAQIASFRMKHRAFPHRANFYIVQDFFGPLPALILAALNNTITL